jgi:hypothetical protein
MRVSNRENDIIASKRMEQIMSAVYAKFGWQGLRPCNSELDKRGIDIVLKTGDETILADEKAATSYWNRDLKTYSCELSCERTKGGYGWFAKESNSYMLNTHIIFIWVKALEKELIHISSIRFLIVDKHILQKYFEMAVGLNADEDTKTYLGRLEWDENGKHIINEDVYLKKCDIYPEFPINVIFSESILRYLADEHFELSRFEVRDALRAAKQQRTM